MTILEAKGIHKTYDHLRQALHVLKGVGLTIDKGEFAAIVGPSGAGKSTLLHILGGLDNPTQGKVIFEGDDIYKLNDAAICRIRNRKIGFVFQFYHLLSEFNVLENVLMPARIAGGAGGIKQKALGLLEKAGLARRAQHFPNQLSGGERQRVAVVRGLINSPSLLLCDEPTGNLDSKTGEEIISLLKEINKADQMSVVLVTHNLDLAKTADKIYHLRDGLLSN